MNPAPKPPRTTPRAPSADLIFLLIFLAIGGVLFIVFVFGLYVVGGLTKTATPTSAATVPVASPLPATGTPTELAQPHPNSLSRGFNHPSANGFAFSDADEEQNGRLWAGVSNQYPGQI